MNGLMPHTATATELQRNYRKVVNRIKKLKRPVTVLSNNTPELVILDYRVFKNWQKSSTKRKKSGLDRLFGTWTGKETRSFNRRIDEMFEKIDSKMWK